MATSNNTSTTTASAAVALPTSTRPPPAWSRRARAVATGPDGDSTAANNATTTTAPSIAVPNTRRELFLGYKCYENPRAHWFIFIPSNTISIIGKVIQVTGNPHTGFGFQIKLNYNSTASMSGTTHFVLLGSVPADQVVDGYTPQLGYGQEL